MKPDRRRKLFIRRYELKRYYVNLKWPMSKIAKKYNCSDNAIHYWLRKYNIKTRSLSEANRISNKYKVTITKNDLERMYNKCKSITKLAYHFNCKNITIMKKLREYNITNKFSSCKRIKIDKKELIELYNNKSLTTYEIADRFYCSQAKVWKLLKGYNIKRRTKQEYYQNIPTKKELINLYEKKKLSTHKIEKVFGYNRGTVFRKIKEYGLKIRTPVESHIKYRRRNFDGGKQEEAYIMGFKLGDLRARKSGGTIKTDCASSKIEQINLIRNLFNNYGRVWVSKPRIKYGKVYRNVEAYLDTSFEFLLQKKAPRWIFNKKEYFIPFLSGFTDAEGHIGVHDKKAEYSIGNYNGKLLNKIKKNILKYTKIKSYIYESDMTKYIRKDGYKYNSSYFGLHITKKRDLLKLFDSVENFMKHRDKLKDIKEARNNINERNKKFGYINM